MHCFWQCPAWKHIREKWQVDPGLIDKLPSCTLRMGIGVWGIQETPAVTIQRRKQLLAIQLMQADIAQARFQHELQLKQEPPWAPPLRKMQENQARRRRLDMARRADSDVDFCSEDSILLLPGSSDEDESHRILGGPTTFVGVTQSTSPSTAARGPQAARIGAAATSAETAAASAAAAGAAPLQCLGEYSFPNTHDVVILSDDDQDDDAAATQLPHAVPLSP